MTTVRAMFVPFVLVLGLAAGGAPARAAAGDVVGSGDFAVVGHPNSNTVTFAFACTGAAPGGVETSVTSCVLSVGGVPVATASVQTAPGSAVTTASTATVIANSPIEVCFAVEAAFADGSTATDEGCGSAVQAG